MSWLEKGLSESKAVWEIVGFHNALHTPPSAGRYLGFGRVGFDQPSVQFVQKGDRQSVSVDRVLAFQLQRCRRRRKIG